jgi:2-polyprenyl-6-methoxyphenol hydroxylase-like FAD-dependent oxidoreductase
MAVERQATIVGASVAGLATACALVERGWSVTVLERRPDLSEGGRAILLQPNGLTPLERLGALGRVRERGQRLSRVVFYGRHHRPVAFSDFGELRHPHPYAVEIRPQALRGALAERLAELGGAPPGLGCELVGLARSGDAVTGARYRDAEGREHELEAACIVGADGPDSTVRERLGIGGRRFPAPDLYLLGTVGVDGGSDELSVHCGPDYGDGVVPLGDGTYFWDRVTSANRAAVESRDLDAWRRVYEGRLPPDSGIPAAVASWDQLTLIHVRPFWAADQIADGAALAGDAAGVVHPHSAQGANLALEDAVALGEVLAGHTGPEAVPRRLLDAYRRPRQRRRRRFVLQSLLAAGTMDAPHPAWRAVRAANFAWSRVGRARRALLRLETGLS